MSLTVGMLFYKMELMIPTSQDSSGWGMHTKWFQSGT